MREVRTPSLVSENASTPPMNSRLDTPSLISDSETIILDFNDLESGPVTDFSQRSLKAKGNHGYDGVDITKLNYSKARQVS